MTLLIFIACSPLFIYPHHITLGPGVLFMTLQVDEGSAVLVSRFPFPTPCITWREAAKPRLSSTKELLSCDGIIHRRDENLDIATVEGVMNVRLSAVRTSRVTRRLQPRDEIFLCRPVPPRPFHKLQRRLPCAAPVAPASATEANNPGRSHADKLTNDSSDISTAKTRAWLLKFRLRCEDLTQFPRASYRCLIPQTRQTSSR
jgi:hypothetical protein